MYMDYIIKSLASLPQSLDAEASKIFPDLIIRFRSKQLLYDDVSHRRMKVMVRWNQSNAAVF